MLVILMYIFLNVAPYYSSIRILIIKSQALTQKFEKTKNVDNEID